MYRIFLVILVFVCNNSFSSTHKHRSIGDVAAASNGIVRGKVREIYTGVDESSGEISTWVVVSDLSALSGTLTQDEIVLKFCGGDYKSSSVICTSSPTFDEGEEYYFFLRQEDGLRLSYGKQGLYQVSKTDKGERYVRSAAFDYHASRNDSQGESKSQRSSSVQLFDENDNPLGPPQTVNIQKTSIVTGMLERNFIEIATRALTKNSFIESDVNFENETTVRRYPRIKGFSSAKKLEEELLSGSKKDWENKVTYFFVWKGLPENRVQSVLNASQTPPSKSRMEILNELGDLLDAEHEAHQRTKISSSRATRQNSPAESQN